MKRRVLWPALLGGTTLVAALLVVELAAGVHRALVCPGYSPTFAVPNRSFGWTHPPSTTVHTYGCAGAKYEWSTTVTFNSRGLNSAEHPYERSSPEVRRVLVLGDSVTEALQVPRSQNFSEQLQAALGGRSRSVEVINSGHSGYGTDNELLFFETEGRRYRPDVVLLAFNLQNDVAENSPAILQKMYNGGPRHPKADVRIASDGTALIDTSPYERFAEDWDHRGWTVRPPMPWLRNNSFFIRHLFDLFATDSAPAASQPPLRYPVQLDVYRTTDTPEWTEAWNLTGALLRELRTATQSAGARLVVAVVPAREIADPRQWSKLVAMFPALASGDWNLDRPRQRILDILTAQHLDVIDTTPVFRRHEAEGTDSGFFGFDPHPDASGQRWIAEAVTPAIERELAAAAAQAEGREAAAAR